MSEIRHKAEIYVNYDEAQTRQNLSSGEEIRTVFGKIKKWFADMGTAAFKDVPSSGDAGNSEVVLGNDSRLSDARTPTTHTQAANTITAMTGYTKPQSTAAVSASDTLNGAIGKLEKALDGKGTSNFSGDYADLSNKPTLGTAAAKDVPASGNALTSQVVMGNDTRLSDSRPASDVSSWAKASTKPTYTASEVGAAPASHTQASSTINAMTDYIKPSSTSAITTSDTLNEAIGKLEKGLEDAGSGSSELEEHIGTNVEDENGVHGIRCYNGKLEVFNAYSEEWLDPSEVGVAVGNVSNLVITKSPFGLNLTWSDPVDIENATWEGTKVVMKAGAYPETINDGQLIYDNQQRDAFKNIPLKIESLTEGVEYYFMLFPYTTTGIVTINNDNRISGVVRGAIELGLRADFVNKVFTRLGDAVGLNGGSDFDDFSMYQRRRCNLANDGTVNAYLGDANYSITGSNGQVMVEQPKFYYKVVPITLNASDNKQLDVAEYWISDFPLEGYRLHPAFYNHSGQEIDYYYIGAYEAKVSYWGESTGLMQSISNVTPSSDTTNGTRSRFRRLAKNRGTGWYIETIWSWSAEQLLMIIEYGKFNMQEAIGNGYVGYTSGVSFLSTGSLNSYGNASYGSTTSETSAVQYRGKENPWGNKACWIDGINYHNIVPSIATTGNYVFSDDSTIYTYLQYYTSSGGFYIESFGYYPDFDWIFMPYGARSGSSSLPVGDYWESYTGAVYSSCVGGYNPDHTKAGPFYMKSANGYSKGDTSVGSRLLYVG